jgi:hypothetical protein
LSLLSVYSRSASCSWTGALARGETQNTEVKQEGLQVSFYILKTRHQQVKMVSVRHGSSSSMKQGSSTVYAGEKRVREAREWGIRLDNGACYACGMLDGYALAVRGEREEDMLLGTGAGLASIVVQRAPELTTIRLLPPKRLVQLSQPGYVGRLDHFEHLIWNARNGGSVEAWVWDMLGGS